jgi:hypothetical protein
MSYPATAAELGIMRQQYPYADPEAHMLVNGEVRLRCQRCKVRPVPRHYVFVANCDPCLDERLAIQRAGS